MTQLTIRNFPPEVEGKIRAIAQKQGWSLNKAAVHLMSRGAGISATPKQERIDTGLDSFIGSWKKAEADRFDKAIQDAFESVDQELWR